MEEKFLVGFAADWFRVAQKLKDDAAFLVAAGTRGGGEPRDPFNTDEHENENTIGPAVEILYSVVAEPRI